jgi:uncharacterized protein (DUF488 family)
MILFSIGHSTRTQDELLALLHENQVRAIADVRRFPGSKRYPYFGSAAMAQWLPDDGIAYVPFPDLGGRRKPLPDSRNTAWRNDQFRAYADYMATTEFHAAIDRLVALAREQTVAFLCAEAVPWRCHRNLIADELTRRGIEVRHIIGSGGANAHVMNEHARIEGDHLVYPAGQQTLRL